MGQSAFFCNNYNNNTSYIQKQQKMTRQEVTAFYNKHYKRLYNASFRIVGNGAEAEEIMQDTILKFLDMEQPPKEEAQISAWLYHTCVRHSIDYVRKHKVKQAFVEEYKYDKLSGSETSNYEKEGKIAAKIAMVKRALDRLKDPYKTMLTLSLIEGYDYQEIAQITEQKETTIRSQISRGKEKLLQEINSL